MAWFPDARAELRSLLGGAWFDEAAAALATPTTTTCLRVNTLRATPEAVRARLSELLPGVEIRSVPGVPEALLVVGAPPARLNGESLDAAARAVCHEVAVNRRCAEAVLRGSNVYAPGVFGCTAGLEPGALVAVTALIEPLGAGSCGMTRGTKLPPRSGLGRGGEPIADAPPPRMLLCVGTAVLSRGDLFRATSGLAVRVSLRRWDAFASAEALAPLLSAGWVQIQNLPSLVAACALNSGPDDRVLDMCAAPGGKTVALAALMGAGGSGAITSLDVNATKIGAIRALVGAMGASGRVTAIRMDATKSVLGGCGGDDTGEGGGAGEAENVVGTDEIDDGDDDNKPSGLPVPSPRGGVYGDDGAVAGAAKRDARASRKAAGAASRGGTTPRPRAPPEPPGAPFPPSSFHKILVDAPCSALGLRPRLAQPVTRPALFRFAGYQRALLRCAVALLRPGGSLVFSTCTISPLENEANVGWLLSTFPSMQLSPHSPMLGGPGREGPAEEGGQPWLTQQQAALVQRFSPKEHDTIGFFIARFEKRME